MNYETISFKEVMSKLKEQKLFDRKGNLIKKQKRDKEYSYNKFVENSGLSVDDAFSLLEYALENDEIELSKKILKASKI